MCCEHQEERIHYSLIFWKSIILSGLSFQGKSPLHCRQVVFLITLPLRGRTVCVINTVPASSTWVTLLAIWIISGCANLKASTKSDCWPVKCSEVPESKTIVAVLEAHWLPAVGGLQCSLQHHNRPPFGGVEGGHLLRERGGDVLRSGAWLVEWPACVVDRGVRSWDTDLLVQWKW